MNDKEKIGSGKEKPLLLVSPLDWGLGHTTRMIPVIRECLGYGTRVVVACNSRQKAILELEFPALEFVHLEGYNVTLGKNRTWNRFQLLLQSVKILTKVNKEEVWFLRFLRENAVAAVISDNRYGLRAPGIPSVLITHQLSVSSGFGRLADRIARHFIYKMVNAFTECWVPDIKDPPGLAGALSHPKVMPMVPVKYMGCLSRFQQLAATEQIDLLVLLSGPEPQRTIFENTIISQLLYNTRKVVLVRGLPEHTHAGPQAKNTVVLNHADADTLNAMVCSASLIICRPGYTTVMDSVITGKKMVTVPTPGQGEQEYLACHLNNTHIAPFLRQETFTMEAAIHLGATYPYAMPVVDANEYKTVIRAFIVSRLS